MTDKSIFEQVFGPGPFSHPPASGTIRIRLTAKQVAQLLCGKTLTYKASGKHIVLEVK